MRSFQRPLNSQAGNLPSSCRFQPGNAWAFSVFEAEDTKGVFGIPDARFEPIDYHSITVDPPSHRICSSSRILERINPQRCTRYPSPISPLSHLNIRFQTLPNVSDRRSLRQSAASSHRPFRAAHLQVPSLLSQHFYLVVNPYSSF